jgi:hypothetical protein
VPRRNARRKNSVDPSRRRKQTPTVLMDLSGFCFVGCVLTHHSVRQIQVRDHAPHDYRTSLPAVFASRLSNDLFNRGGTFNADESLFETVVEVRQLVGVEAELIENCGVQILDVVAIFHGLAA